LFEFTPEEITKLPQAEIDNLIPEWYRKTRKEAQD
jgi:hypothetical protein